MDKAALDKKIYNMVGMQISLNNNTNGKCWVNNITKDGKTINWPLCIVLEVSEAIGSIPWKHWKDINNQVVDFDNLKIELTDIYHFLISLVANSQHLKSLTEEQLHVRTAMMLEYNTEQLFFALGRSIETGFTKEEIISKLLVLKLSVLKYHLQYNTYSNQYILDIVTNFYICVLTIPDFNMDDLYKLYISKNVLNTFRQDNGYKENTYIKIWNGLEDNVYITNYLVTNPDATPEEIYEYLTQTYANIDCNGVLHNKAQLVMELDEHVCVEESNTSTTLRGQKDVFITTYDCAYIVDNDDDLMRDKDYGDTYDDDEDDTAYIEVNSDLIEPLGVTNIGINQCDAIMGSDMSYDADIIENSNGSFTIKNNAFDVIN